MTSDRGSAFGVYVHWPFCASKCPYCDFNSHVRHNAIDQKLFCNAYEREIDHIATIVPDRTVTSIFFGGGTPSLMQVDTVGQIIDLVASKWDIADDAEITLEANPQSVDAGRFAGYRAAGVNRVSLGVQSLDDKVLRFFGRLHDADEARRAIEVARKNFDRMSFDLIYAYPDQTREQWARELETAIDLAADHLSLYQLTIEQGTPFFALREAGKLDPMPEDDAAGLYEVTQEITSRYGLPAYEISNHAKPGEECRHNLVYWRGQEYAGIGPGAHGRLATATGRVATAMIANPEAWWQHAMTEGHGLAEYTLLGTDELYDERLLFGLRLAEGLDLAGFEEITGTPLNSEKLEFLTQIGMLETLGNSRVRATPTGFLVLDAVVADLAS